MENVSTPILKIGELAKALSAAQGELSTASKSSVNPHFKSKFADLTEVWEACRAALSKHKIAVIQCPQQDASGEYLETILAHESGEYMSSRMPLKNAKGDMQGFGSALTYARRYSLAAMVGVTSEDDDGNAASMPPQRPMNTLSTRQVSSGYDPKNLSHVKGLETELSKRGISGQWRANVVSAMPGRSLSDLDSVIDQANPTAPDKD